MHVSATARLEITDLRPVGYANESVIEFYDSLAAKAEKAPEPSQDALFDADAPADALPAPTDKEGRTDDGMVYIKCPAQIADRVRG